jgi:hypothetical protein
MRIQVAAGFSAVTILSCILFAIVGMGPSLRIVGVFLPRQVWLSENPLLWMGGLWLWLLGIFSWMLLLVALLWSYSPAHRITTMLQSGLMLLGAGLAIGGVVVWMNAMPYAIEQPDAPVLAGLVDAVALGFLGAGCFMAGVVTLWMGLDLARLGAMPWAWLAPLIGAGLCALPTPFLLPHQPWLLAAGGVLWCAGCLHLALRRRMPQAFTEWT